MNLTKLISIVPCTKEEAEFHKNSHKTIHVEKKGGGNDKFYLKYMKYKLKYLRLKQIAGSLTDKVFLHVFHELDKIQVLLNELLLCTSDETHENSKIISEIKKLTRDIVNNISLKIDSKNNIVILSKIKNLYTSMIINIKNKCNIETMETIRVKFEYIIDELEKIII